MSLKNSKIFGVLLFVTAVVSFFMFDRNKLSCASDGINTDDPFLWLEEIDAPKAVEWAKARSEKTVTSLKSDPRFSVFHQEIEAIELAQDRIPSIGFRGGYVYNFWQDQKNVQGLWRRTTLTEYQKEKPVWENILDLDELSKKESKKWVWKSAQCLPPSYERCLLTLSNGGGDASVVREFDVKSKTFIENGFIVPEAKSNVTWVDENHILVGTKFNDDSLTDSSYPRVVKKWKRGTLLESAELFFEGLKTDVWVRGYTIQRPERNYTFANRGVTFFTEKNWLQDSTGKLIEVAFPESTKFLGAWNGYVFGILRESLKKSTGEFIAVGSLVALPVSKIQDQSAIISVMTPNSKSTIESVSFGKDVFYVSGLENVRAKLYKFTEKSGVFESKLMDYPDNGIISLGSIDPFTQGAFTLEYENFLTPGTQYFQDEDQYALNPLKLKQRPARFDATDFVVEQRESTSRDGTKIPYFMISKKGIKLDGTNPTIQYGYGGFEISRTPFYLGSWGKVWIERGGVLVIANIRGGGEFGPKWHRAALKENRQIAYDDFISVSEHLFETKVSTPGSTLSIEGGSNGGLLVGAVFVQKPHYYKAVVTQVPLLDMMRYHKMVYIAKDGTKNTTGASWVGEYGNPDTEPSSCQAILKYSPYQNLKKDVKYPSVLFVTSSKDDRVHPGHARKMAAKMEAMAHGFEYYENVNGGHSGSANLDELVTRKTIEFTYLARELGLKL